MASLRSNSILKIYYRDSAVGAPVEPAFMERDLSIGRDHELIRRPNLGAVNLSLNGKFIATGSLDAAAKVVSLLLIPTNGSQSRELMRFNQADWNLFRHTRPTFRLLWVLSSNWEPPARRHAAAPFHAR
jgi:hypothetical protein